MIETFYSMKLRDKNLFKQFVQKQNYEPFLLNLLNSSYIFNNQLSIISKQDNSEGDFIDTKTGICYEATLLMNETIISKIIKDPAYLGSENYKIQRVNDLISLFKERIMAKQSKKMPIILFNIIPDVCIKFQGSITEQIFRDSVDEIIDELFTNVFGDSIIKEIILVSFNYDGSFYIRTIYPNMFNLNFINQYIKNKFPLEIVESKVIVRNS